MREVVSEEEREQGGGCGYINWWQLSTSLVEPDPQQINRMKSVFASIFVIVLRVDTSLARIVHLGKGFRKKISIFDNCYLAKNENENNESSRFKRIECPEDEASQRRLSATILLVLAGLGVLANLVVVLLLLASRSRVVIIVFTMYSLSSLTW